MTETRRQRKAEWMALCRRGIREAAVRILSRDGAEGLTMEKLAAEAGVAKGTLYLYYRDKKELLESVKEESLKPMREELAEVLDGSLPPQDKIRQFVSRHLGYFDKNRDFFRVLLWDRQFAQAYFRHKQGSHYRTSVPKVAKVLEEGLRSGVFRPMNAVTVAAMLIESDIVVIAQRLHEEAPGPVEEDAKMLLDVFLNGISARRATSGRQP